MTLNKEIQAIFFIRVQNGSKSRETTHSIDNTFAPGTANKPTVKWWFKKFYKGDERLEDEEHNGRPSEVDIDNWEPSSKPILL